MPKATAIPAQTSANSTAWSLKKLPTISVPTPSQGQRRVSPARAGFYPMGLLRRFGVSKLEVGRDLLEIAHELVGHIALEHRQQRSQRLDRQVGLIQIPVFLRQLAVAERRNRVERLDEEVGDLQLLQLFLELLHQLLVARRRYLAFAHAGSHSSNLLPSGSTAQPKRPYSISCTRSSTATPPARSCSSIASRSWTRKLTISCWSREPKYSVSAGKGAQTVWSPSPPVKVVP